MAQKTLLHFDIKRHIALCLEIRHCTMPLEAVLYFGKKIVLLHCETLNKGNNKITELRTILQRESQNS